MSRCFDCKKEDVRLYGNNYQCLDCVRDSQLTDNQLEQKLRQAQDNLNAKAQEYRDRVASGEFKSSDASFNRFITAELKAFNEILSQF